MKMGSSSAAVIGPPSLSLTSGGASQSFGLHCLSCPSYSHSSAVYHACCESGFSSFFGGTCVRYIGKCENAMTHLPQRTSRVR